MSENKCIKILFVEDVDSDAELTIRTLRNSGLIFISKRVENEESFISELKNGQPDIVISDYMLPTFDGMKALKLTKSHDKYIPFLILTGSMNEETAVTCMKAGADDYVIKEHLTRLPFAVTESIVKKQHEKNEMKNRELLDLKARELASKQESLIQASRNWQSTFDAIDDFVILITADNSIIEANNAVLKAFHKSAEEIHGLKCYNIIHNGEGPILKCPCFKALTEKRAVFEEYTENGKTFEFIVWPIFDEKKEIRAFTHIIKDITVRKKNEEDLKTSIKEKETLLKELYHRTKNNMNVIMSFLLLQKNYLNDDKLIIVLNDMISRIQSIALVHQKLYQSKNLSRINIGEYVIDLVNSIRFSYLKKDVEINFFYDIENIEVLLDTAAPIGMVINEIVTNSLKYAFDDKTGRIDLSLKMEKENIIEIKISDNGKGLPENFDIDKSHTLGMLTIRSLVENQLGGHLEIYGKNGVSYDIKIRKDLYSERI
jgi:PAS domain S-box-containing protein